MTQRQCKAIAKKRQNPSERKFLQSRIARLEMKNEKDTYRKIISETDSILNSRNQPSNSIGDIR